MEIFCGSRGCFSELFNKFRRTFFAVTKVIWKIQTRPWSNSWTTHKKHLWHFPQKLSNKKKRSLATKMLPINKDRQIVFGTRWPKGNCVNIRRTNFISFQFHVFTYHLNTGNRKNKIRYFDYLWLYCAFVVLNRRFDKITIDLKSIWIEEPFFGNNKKPQQLFEHPTK